VDLDSYGTIFFESETHVLYDHFLVQTVTKPHFLWLLPSCGPRDSLLYRVGQL